MVDLGTFGGTYGQANDINDVGQVVGMSTNAGGNQRAFFWTAAGGMVDLGTLGGLQSSAFGINDDGQVVGWSTNAGGDQRAFFWTAADGMVDLGTLGGVASPYRINDAGDVVGYSWTAGAAQRATIWSGPWHDVALDFGTPYGIWTAHRGGVWRPVHSYFSPEAFIPEAMVTGDLDGNGLDDLVVGFGGHYGNPGGVWVWMNHATWTPLVPGNSASRMVIGDLDNNGRDEVIINFSGPYWYGVWIWQNNESWRFVYHLNASHLATGNLDGVAGDELIIDFPHGIFVYDNNGAFTPLHGLHAATLVTADNDGSGQDDVVIDFPGYGLWVFRNNATWAPLHSFSPLHVASGDIDGNARPIWSSISGRLRVVDLPKQYDLAATTPVLRRRHRPRGPGWNRARRGCDRFRGGVRSLAVHERQYVEPAAWPES